MNSSQMRQDFELLQRMSQILVDNNVITKEEKIDLTLQDFDRIKKQYDLLSYGIVSFGIFKNKQYKGLYTNIN